MIRQLVATLVVAAVCVLLSSRVGAAQARTGERPRMGAAGADPGSRGPIALVVDPRGLEWCDAEVCFRTMRVLAVIRNRTRHPITNEITMFRRREDPPMVSAEIFVRMECGVGPSPLWRVFPATEPVDERVRFMATFGPVRPGFAVSQTHKSGIAGYQDPWK